MAWITMGELRVPGSSTVMTLLAVVTLVLAAGSSSGCPNNVLIEAHGCFENYSVRYDAIWHSEKLCCGVNVERLRAFCKSFIEGMRCVAVLKSRCPAEKHRMIDHSLSNLDGARQELTDLCEDDRIIETYAMLQSCFSNAKEGSEACLRRHLESSTSSSTGIKLLSNVDTNNMDQFCSKMQDTVACVQDNIQRSCDNELAANMVAVLVKPMVRHSAQCDYSVDIAADQEDDQHSYQGGNPAYISDDHAAGGIASSSSSSNGAASGSSSSSSRSSSSNKRRGTDGHRNSGSRCYLSGFHTLLVILSVLSCHLYRFNMRYSL